MRAYALQVWANPLWAYERMGREPGGGVRRGRGGGAEAVVSTFNAQDAANTLWAYATIGAPRSARVKRWVDGGSDEEESTLYAQGAANTGWAPGIGSPAPTG